MSEHDVMGVTNTINDYLDAYNARNIEALGNVVVNNDNLVAFGTDEGEYWKGWTTFRNITEKLFGAIDEIHFERGKPVIHFSNDGNVAWFAEELHGNFVSADEKHGCTFRLSGVSEKINNKWKIVQFHRSVAVKDHAVPYLETHGVRFD